MLNLLVYLMHFPYLRSKFACTITSLCWIYIWAYLAAANTMGPLFQRSSLGAYCNVPSNVDMWLINLLSLYQIFSSVVMTVDTKWKLPKYTNPLKSNVVFPPFWFIILIFLSMVILHLASSMWNILMRFSPDYKWQYILFGQCKTAPCKWVKKDENTKLHLTKPDSKILMSSGAWHKLQFQQSVTDIILGAFTNDICGSICPPHMVHCCWECCTLISELMCSLTLYTCLSICECTHVG